MLPQEAGEAPPQRGRQHEAPEDIRATVQGKRRGHDDENKDGDEDNGADETPEDGSALAPCPTEANATYSGQEREVACRGSACEGSPE